MNAELLDRIRFYCERATPGPWWSENTTACFDEVRSEAQPVIAEMGTVLVEFMGGTGPSAYPNSHIDVQFIAQAREWVPMLVAEIDRLRSTVGPWEAT